MSSEQGYKNYIPVKSKFVAGHIGALLWLCFSIYMSIPWVIDLAKVTNWPLSILIITGIAYIPGYCNTFLVISLLVSVNAHAP